MDTEIRWIRTYSDSERLLVEVENNGQSLFHGADHLKTDKQNICYYNRER